MADKQLSECGATIKTAYESQSNTNAYTDAEKSKLSGIQAGAQVNAVNTVNGQTGTVVITKSDIALSNVDNTSDVNKPISTAQQNALNTKATQANANVWPQQQTVQGTDLTDASNVSWNLNTQASTYLLMTAAIGATRVLSNPTNMVKGATYMLAVKQDSVGGRALTFGTAYKWAGGVAPTLSNGANAIDIISFYCDGTNMYGTIIKNFA